MPTKNIDEMGSYQRVKATIEVIVKKWEKLAKTENERGKANHKIINDNDTRALGNGRLLNAQLVGTSRTPS